MKHQINEIERMQQLAGILTEAAPAMPPVPGQKPPMPSMPGKVPAAPVANARPLDDKKKAAAMEAFFQANLYITTLKTNKLLSDPDIKQLEALLNKAIGAIGDSK